MSNDTKDFIGRLIPATIWLVLCLLAAAFYGSCKTDNPFIIGGAVACVIVGVIGWVIILNAKERRHDGRQDQTP